MFQLPTDKQRVVVVGRTGSGKTFMGVALLGKRDFSRMPWIIIDYKGDALIAELDAKEISVQDAPPTKPGLYVIRPFPQVDDAALERFLWLIHGQENTGIYVDEGYAIDRSSAAFNALLTRGRSKHIPMIILSQRPVWMSKFCFSEADYFSIFDLNIKDDVKILRDYTTDNPMLFAPKPKYHSIWYDVAQAKFFRLQPVPDEDILISTINAKLQRRVKVI